MTSQAACRSKDQVDAVIEGIEQAMADQDQEAMKDDRRKGMVSGLAVMRDVFKRDLAAED